jgi:RNase adapter protein RapZ
MATAIHSFGYKHGRLAWNLPEAALVLDVRHFRNPHQDPTLRALGGDDPRIAADIAKTIGYEAKFQEILNRARSYAGPVYLGCTGGIHRSVALAILVGRELGIPVRHLDYTPHVWTSQQKDGV